MVAQVIRFENLPFLVALRRVRSLRVEECCGVIWMLQLVVQQRFCPEHFVLDRAALFGADLTGRFSIRGEIVTQERLHPMENGMCSARMAFRATQKSMEFLDRVRFDPQDPSLSNLRYLAFPSKVTKFQLENAGFSIHLTGEQASPKRHHGK